MINSCLVYLKKSKGFEVENPHGLRVIGEQKTIFFFAIAQGFFSLLAVGNIVDAG